MSNPDLRSECPYCGGESLRVTDINDVIRWHCRVCDITWRSRGGIPLCDVCNGPKVVAGTSETMSGQPDTSGERAGHARARANWRCPVCSH